MLEEIKTTQAWALSHQLVEIMGLACVSPLVLAQTASLALLRGAWEKLDLEIQHTTRPPSAGISPTSMLLSRSLFMSLVTNVKVMFTTSTMQLPGLGWWLHSLTPIGPWHLVTSVSAPASHRGS